MNTHFNRFTVFNRDDLMARFHLFPTIDVPILERVVGFQFVDVKVDIIDHYIGDPPGHVAIMAHRYPGQSGYRITGHFKSGAGQVGLPPQRWIGQFHMGVIGEQRLPVVDFLPDTTQLLLAGDGAIPVIA